MSSALNWLKSNWLTVALAAVAIISLPALLIVSSGMNATLQEDVQQDIDGKQRAIQQVSVTYDAPSLDSAQPSLSFSRPPNEATTEAMGEYLRQLEEQVRLVERTAIAHNSDGKQSMVEGLFPEPDASEATRLRQETGRIWVEAHERLLREAGAGTPPDPEDVRQRLLVERERIESRLLGEGMDVESEEAQARIEDELSSLRISLYRSRANELRFYASPDVFQGVAAPPEGQLPDLAAMWDWQFRLWIHEDLVESLSKSNLDPVTRVPLPVPEAPAKRILSISAPSWSYGGSASPDGRGGGPAADYNMSITGRAGWPNTANELYVIRYARMDVILSSRELPRLIDAIATTNLMTVVDVDIASVNERADLAAGYFYGGDHVVRANLLIETLWLKDWLGEYAPPVVREAMGLPAPEVEGETDGESENRDME